ncbi:DUF6396 domain-containing protein [Caballeronia cordobensis]|uniref:DUF6396 domain-containing protein n=1 Tax=Caballeronia cordobensis TaxID=1353886 RepID=UPI0039B91DA6
MGIDFSERERFSEAVDAYQEAVRAGNAMSAFSLREGFKGPEPTEKLTYLGLQRDSEQVSRYKKLPTFSKTTNR